ncbi:hypothetical protein FA13DRAFT_1746639 [Coprinellus micaceus]|uniref:Uncharacterized protein n=1 Tax=Coprinellus micaceus TaxID=71717 RepID=A0A4Y7S8H5_COPMI|nr:hypothetical protein FA13DRAFT_1746639 [Coprinellus micaceus]
MTFAHVHLEHTVLTFAPNRHYWVRCRISHLWRRLSIRKPRTNRSPSLGREGFCWTTQRHHARQRRRWYTWCSTLQFYSNVALLEHTKPPSLIPSP